MKTQLFSIIFPRLFADAESGEDGAEHFLVVYHAEDGGEVGDALAEVLGDEVAGEVEVEGIDGAGDVGLGLSECLVVAEIGHEEVRIGGGEGLYARYELLLKGGDADAIEGLEIVGFVDDTDDGLVVAQGNVGVGDIWLGEQDDDLCLVGGSDASLYAHLLDGVGGVAYAGGVDEAKGDVAKG